MATCSTCKEENQAPEMSLWILLFYSNREGGCGWQGELDKHLSFRRGSLSVVLAWAWNVCSAPGRRLLSGHSDPLPAQCVRTMRSPIMMVGGVSSID